MGGVNLELNKENLAVSIEELSINYFEFRRSIRKPLGKLVPIPSLRDIDMDVPIGQNTAIIGRNGAGKSTLIKAISGHLRPHSGSIEVSGKVITLAGVNPGFQPHLSPNSNVRLLGVAYGVKREEIDDFTKEVENFADIGDAYYRQFQGLSSGMRGKVGFGFITALNPEILLIDETLGVGDLEFRKKASDRLEEFIERSGTVLISTHSLGLAKEMCSHGILLKDGSLVFYGPIDEAIDIYSEKNR